MFIDLTSLMEYNSVYRNKVDGLYLKLVINDEN